MCRAEAHQLYTRKPIFDAMGIQLVVCLNDYIESEVCLLYSYPHFTISYYTLIWSQWRWGVKWIWISKIILVSPKSYHLWAFWSIIKRYHTGISSSLFVVQHGCNIKKHHTGISSSLLVVQRGCNIKEHHTEISPSLLVVQHCSLLESNEDWVNGIECL